MFPELHRFPYFAYDTETTGLHWQSGDRVFGFSISTPDGKDYYYDIRQQPRAWEWFGDIVRRLDPSKHRIICWNASFDYHMSRASGVTIPLGLLDDACTRACLLDEHHFSYELDHIGKKILGRQKEDIVPVLAELFGGRKTRNVQMPNLQHAPVETTAVYAKGDTRLTLDLWEWQEEEICRQDNCRRGYLPNQSIIPVSRIIDFERRLMPLIIHREERGIRVDTAAAEKAQIGLTARIDPQQRKLNDICGFEVNVNSNTGKNSHMHKVFEPKQRPDGIWIANNGEILGTTPSGNASLARDVLQALDHPAAKLIVELRGLLRLRDTFLGEHVLGHEINGRVYPRINQNKGEDGGTGTGRLSYVDPAMQQIPARDKEKSRVIRPVFLPEEGQRWVATDKASFEVRVFAHLVNNPTVNATFAANPYTDFHEYVADAVGIPRNMPAEGGANGKQLNLSMIFNQGEGSTAIAMGLPWYWDEFLPRDRTDKPENWIRFRKAGPEAKKVIEAYHATIPGIRDFARRAKDTALDRGYVATKMGRRLRFPRGFKAYKASGLLIQATAADWNKENWMLINEALDGEGEMLLNIHDGYELSLPEGREEKIARRVKEHVERQTRSRIPLILEISPPGANWWDSYSGKTWIK